MRGATRLRRARSAIVQAVKRGARSRGLSAAAAVAIVLGTAGTYISGDIAGDIQSCNVRRELLKNGSPDLQELRAALHKIPEARAYAALALGTMDVEQRREYAFLAVTAANTAIMLTPSLPDAKPSLFEYPTDQQLTSLRYMVALSRKVNDLDIRQLPSGLRAHDRNFLETISDLNNCDHMEDVGDAFGGAAILLTLLSLALIGLREYHQGRRKQ